MKSVYPFAAAGFAMVAALAGCEAPGQMSAADAVPLTREEVVARITGNTEFWRTGAGYYDPDGTLRVRWRGKDGIGTYTVTEGGQVCYTVDIWGNTRDCHSYAVHDGEVMFVYHGDLRQRRILEGNQLGAS